MRMTGVNYYNLACKICVNKYVEEHGRRGGEKELQAVNIV